MRKCSTTEENCIDDFLKGVRHFFRVVFLLLRVGDPCLPRVCVTTFILDTNRTRNPPDRSDCADAW